MKQFSSWIQWNLSYSNSPMKMSDIRIILNFSEYCYSVLLMNQWSSTELSMIFHYYSVIISLIHTARSWSLKISDFSLIRIKRVVTLFLDRIENSRSMYQFEAPRILANWNTLLQWTERASTSSTGHWLALIAIYCNSWIYAIYNSVYVSKVRSFT